MRKDERMGSMPFISSFIIPHSSLSCGGQRWFHFLQRLKDGLHERRQVVGFPAGNQVAVADHFRIHVLAAGVDHVILDREEASRLSAFERLGRAQYQGP